VHDIGLRTWQSVFAPFLGTVAQLLSAVLRFPHSVPPLEGSVVESMLEAKPVDLLDKEREPVVSGGPDPILCESHRSVQDSRIAVQDIRGKTQRPKRGLDELQCVQPLALVLELNGRGRVHVAAIGLGEVDIVRIEDGAVHGAVPVRARPGAVVVEIPVDPVLALGQECTSDIPAR
jgi:hypothetical protein